MSSEQELRDSIAAIGCIDPVLIWLGAVIDGRKRHAICAELGVIPRMHVCVTLDAACAALFQKHPLRAIALAREHLGGSVGLPPTVHELAETCHVSVSAIAVHTQGPRAPDRRAPHRTSRDRNLLLQVWVEPQWMHYVKLAGEAAGMNLSQTVRVACWEFVQRNTPNAPTEGTRRAPLPEHVRKPSRIKKPP